MFSCEHSVSLCEYLPSDNCTLLVLRAAAASATVVNFPSVLLSCNYLKVDTGISMRFRY